MHDLQFTVDLVQPISFFCLKQAVLAPSILNLSQLFSDWLSIINSGWGLCGHSHICVPEMTILGISPLYDLIRAKSRKENGLKQTLSDQSEAQSGSS